MLFDKQMKLNHLNQVLQTVHPIPNNNNSNNNNSLSFLQRCLHCVVLCLCETQSITINKFNY